MLLRGRESGLRIRCAVQSWSLGLVAFVRPRRGGSQSSFVIESVMKIDPEAAVELEDGERPVGEIALRPGCRSNGCKQRKYEQEKRESRWRSARHSESH